MLSDYRSDSELMRLCRQAGGDPVHVSDELFFVLSRAQEVSRISDGAFDVTVGPVVKLWRRVRRTGRLPEPAVASKFLAANEPDKRQKLIDSLFPPLPVPGMRSVSEDPFFDR